MLLKQKAGYSRHAINKFFSSTLNFFYFLMGKYVQLMIDFKFYENNIENLQVHLYHAPVNWMYCQINTITMLFSYFKI